MISLNAPNTHPQGVGRQWYELFPANWYQAQEAVQMLIDFCKNLNSSEYKNLRRVVVVASRFLYDNKNITKENHPFVSDIRENSNVKLANGNITQSRWIQFKIPIQNYSEKVGTIEDFKSIRFIRTFFTGFEDTVVCRFATLELVRGEWRRYLNNLSTGNNEEFSNNSTQFDISVVNYEENAHRSPVPYNLPPGIERETMYGATSFTQQNEQSMVLKISDLEDGDARAAFKKAEMDGDIRGQELALAAIDLIKFEIKYIPNQARIYYEELIADPNYSNDPMRSYHDYNELTDFLNDKSIPIEACLGHSVGEYAALAACGAISTEDAIKAVHHRGKFMQQAVPVGKGKMIALLKVPEDIVLKACETASNEEEKVMPANFNEPNQIVISGHSEAALRAVKWLEENYESPFRSVELKVSAPFHSSLMEPAKNKLGDFFQNISFTSNKLPYIANIDSKKYPVETPGEVIQNNLINQVQGSVLWTQSMQKIPETSLCIEVGPGKVLTGLGRKINRSLKVVPLDTEDAFTKLEEILS